MPTKDLICANRHFEGDVLIPHMDDPNPPCPECGLPRTRSYLGPDNVPAIKLFVPHHHPGFGMVQNEDDWKVLRNQLAKAQGAKPEDFIQYHETKAERMTTADEHRQRSYDKQKRKGLDPKQIREIKDTTRRTKVNPLTGVKPKPERKWRKKEVK